MNAIRFFEAAAEHESFARAAEDLLVTRGAVSQQIKQLETYLGLPLFERDGRGLRLTDVGRRYHTAVRRALNTIEKETSKYVGNDPAELIRISVLPAIASLWLVPRLSEFQRHHGHLEVQVSADADMVDLSRSDVQIGIRFGLGETKGCEFIDLGTDDIFPVGTPAYLGTHGIVTRADIANGRLLHDTYWSDDWEVWGNATGVSIPTKAAGQYFTHYSLAVDAALGSAGLLMAHGQLIAQHLVSGDLVPIDTYRVACREPYYIVYPRKLKYHSDVQAFVEWFAENFGS